MGAARDFSRGVDSPDGNWRNAAADSSGRERPLRPSRDRTRCGRTADAHRVRLLRAGAGPVVVAQRRQSIYLTPERETWKAGETARILIQSPWPRATALVTVEREGVRSHRVFTITSTQDTVDVPITAADAPNVYVSVMLVKGRTSAGPVAKMNRRSGRLHGAVRRRSREAAARGRVGRSRRVPPGGPATITAAVRRRDGMPAPAEVTLWAIDQGLLL